MIIYKFSTTWCAACERLDSVLEELKASNFPNVNLIKDIDIDKNEDLSIKYIITMVPTLMWIDDSNNNTMVKMYVGTDKARVKQFLASPN